MHKEMVFDIDMDVYDDVRSCCSGAKVCNKCWAYPMVAMKVLTVLLDEDFDFQNILWVFSGRRGIHGWVCDEEARTMTNEMRTAMVAYCNLGTGNELAGKLSLQQPLHPRLRNIFIMLYPMFEQIIIEDHNLLAQETHREKFL
jgi:DNA primase small subunit